MEDICPRLSHCGLQTWAAELAFNFRAPAPDPTFKRFGSRMIWSIKN